MMLFSRQDKGKKGEEMAACYLKKQGYRIVGRNLSCRYGEIDLIVQKGDSLFFVEVRRRTGVAFGSALESISPKKITRLKKTVQYFWSQNKEWHERVPFYSVFTIDESPTSETRIEFLPNAFE